MVDRFQLNMTMSTAMSEDPEIEVEVEGDADQPCCAKARQMHREDSNPQLTVLHLVLFVVPLVRFSYSSMAQDYLILNFSIIMVHIYWAFSQIWFINQSFQGLRTQKGEHYLPQNSELLRTFEEFNSDVTVNRYKDAIIVKACEICQSPQQQGTKHCHACERCVNYFSHHSGYYNRCIGEENHLAYITVMFNQLLVLTLYLIRVLIDSNATYYESIYVIAWYKTLRILLQTALAISRNLTLDEYQNPPGYEVPSHGCLSNVVMYVSHHVASARIKSK